MQNSVVNAIADTNLVVLGLVKNETTVQWLQDYIVQKNITFDMLHTADEVFDLYGVHI